jgi:hypothetical protein
MGTNGTRHHKRTNLFLLRVWTEDLSGGASSNVEWNGSVQRVVDGEARQFKGWQDLLETLLAMVSNTEANLDQ